MGSRNGVHFIRHIAIDPGEGVFTAHAGDFAASSKAPSHRRRAMGGINDGSNADAAVAVTHT